MPEHGSSVAAGPPYLVSKCLARQHIYSDEINLKVNF